MKVLVFIIFIVILFFLSTFLSDYVSLPDIPFVYQKKQLKGEDKNRDYLKKEMKKAPFMCQSVFYSPELFPGLSELQEHWETLQEEAIKVYKHSALLLKVHRKREEWTQTVTQDTIDKYSSQEGWIAAWNPRSDAPNKEWLNYGLIVKDEVLTKNGEQCPRTIELLSKIEGINIAGFSWMKPHSEIALHRDSTGLNYRSLTYHLGLMISEEKGAFLTVEGKREVEAEGKVIIFDSSFLHSAVNSTGEDRIILYVDFNLDL